RFGFRSHQLAKAARDSGAFAEETVPVTVRTGDATLAVKHDSHILDDASMAKMARLAPAFEPGGIVTAGNASAVVGGAGAMLIGKESDVNKHGLTPLARIAGMGVAACDPRIMGCGPVPATKR